MPRVVLGAEFLERETKNIAVLPLWMTKWQLQNAMEVSRNEGSICPEHEDRNKMYVYVYIYMERHYNFLNSQLQKRC